MGHRARWIAFWGLLLVWFAAMVFGWGGNTIHLALVLALAALLYELMAREPGPG